VEFAGGVLAVEVPDSSWQNELAELKPQYLRELERLLGAPAVKRIEFVVGRKRR
jgi:hypothetical protein